MIKYSLLLVAMIWADSIIRRKMTIVDLSMRIVYMLENFDKDECNKL